MPNDLTFKEVCTLLKKDDGRLIDAVDNFLGVAIVLSPVVAGPEALPALGLLGAKNALTNLGKSLINKVTSKKEADYLARMKRMEMAYGLICFTAFFEALDQLLPDDLRKQIALLPQEKVCLAKQAVGQTVNREEDRGTRGTSEPLREGILDLLLPFPHPVVPFEEQKEHLGRLYKNMANCFDGFIKKLAIWEKANEKVAANIQEVIKNIPKTSLDYFESQYLELARTYNDFCMWSRLHEHKTTQSKLKESSDYLKYYVSLSVEGNKKIDIGFERLQEAVLAIPDQFKEVQARDVVDGLQRHYEARINEPIIEDEYRSEDGKPALNFPKISEAFIPQSYRVLRKTMKDSHLEREETWKDIELEHNLGPFLLSYLSSPYSIETPLLILGHPGSGKSLLTKVLCARIISQAYTPIRVPLREVNADWPIEEKIESIIGRTTGNKIIAVINRVQ